MARIITLPWAPSARSLRSVLGIPLVSLNRTTAASAFFALYITSSLLLRSFASPWLGIGWTSLAIGVWLAPKSLGPKPLFVGLIMLLLFHALAIPGSLLWGSGNWESTTAVVLWMAPGMLLYLGGTRSTLVWLTPVFLTHAGLIIYQGFTLWTWVPSTDIYVATGVPHGLANNPNLAAGVLTLGLVFFMASRRWQWQAFIIPMALALLFTGSRWGLLVAGCTLPLMAITGAGSVRTMICLLLGLCAAFVIMALFSPNGYRIAGYNNFAAAIQVVENDIQARLALPHLPSILPHGLAAHPGLHNVPLRIAVESGIQAAVLWVGVSLWALWRRPLRTEWWMLLTLVLLSMLDYYTWMGHLGGFWWLLIGLLAKGRDSTLAKL